MYFCIWWEFLTLTCLRTCHFHRFTWFAVPETFRSICVLRKWMIRSSTCEHLLVVVHTKKKSNARWIAFCVVSIFSADRGDCWHISRSIFFHVFFMCRLCVLSIFSAGGGDCWHISRSISFHFSSFAGFILIKSRSKNVRVLPLPLWRFNFSTVCDKPRLHSPTTVLIFLDTPPTTDRATN